MAPKLGDCMIRHMIGRGAFYGPWSRRGDPWWSA